MRLAMTVTSVLLLSLPALAEDDPRREAVHRRAQPELVGEEPAWRRELRRSLDERKVSFDYVQLPLSEAILYLVEKTGLNIILDPEALREAGDTPISLKVFEMPVAHALKWLLEPADLCYDLKDGAVFVTVWRKLQRDVVRRIYEVHDIAAATWERPEPHDALSGFGQRRGGGELRGIGELADFIRDIHPTEWGVEIGTSIEARGGHLVILQRPEVHAEIVDCLRRLRERLLLQVRIDAKLFAMSESFLSKLRALTKPGEGTIYLKPVELDLIDRILKEGKDVQLVAAAHATCFNAQRNNSHGGQSIQRVFDDKGKRQRFFFGTELDVRPLVSFDRKYVTFDMRLTRCEPLEDEERGAQVYRFSTTTTCLDTDTVMVAGASMPRAEGKPPRRLVALVTPTILRLEPPKPLDAAARE